SLTCATVAIWPQARNSARKRYFRALVLAEDKTPRTTCSRGCDPFAALRRALHPSAPGVTRVVRLVQSFPRHRRFAGRVFALQSAPSCRREDPPRHARVRAGLLQSATFPGNRTCIDTASGPLLRPLGSSRH